MKTNIQTTVKVEGKEISISKLLLLIQRYTSELDHFQNLNERGFFGRSRRISTAEEEQKKVPFMDDLELEEKVRSLEDKKITLESKLDYLNATKELIE